MIRRHRLGVKAVKTIKKTKLIDSQYNLPLLSKLTEQTV